MRLSDSIALGSTVVTARPWVLHKDGGTVSYGCALGMAAVAVGATWVDATEEELRIDSRTTGMEKLWPWLDHSLRFPCDCHEHRSSNSDKAKTVIAHMFDWHVYGRREWTLEQLVEFVASVEPEAVKDQVFEEVLVDSK